MSARHWSDAYANTAGLADAVERIPGATPRAVGAGLRLADALKTQAVPDLSGHTLHTVDGKWSLHDLADAADMYADVMAKAGNYPAYVVLTDASAALRELATDSPQLATDSPRNPPPCRCPLCVANSADASAIETGEFRAVRSEVIAGVAITEYEGEDTARYVAIGHGQSDQPPELVRVWAADPDDTDEDDGVPL